MAIEGKDDGSVSRRLRLGMVGGGRGAFIGAVHRIAAQMDGKAELVASDHCLTDEITLIPTPGHSPGHMSILITSDGETGLLTGDVAHHPCQMAHLDWSSTADFDPVQSAATRRELFSRFADTPTLTIGGHFDAGHIKRDGDAFKFIAA